MIISDNKPNSFLETIILTPLFLRPRDVQDNNQIAFFLILVLDTVYMLIYEHLKRRRSNLVT